MNELRDQFLIGLKSFHRYFRKQKVDAFLRMVGGKRASLLDLGGGPGVAGEFRTVHESFEYVVLANISLPKWETTLGSAIRLVVADGCALPFASRSFDWVFSNAVIEHVGGKARQKQFADEIRRVSAKGYFVATPNKNFPIEPHTLLPFYQFLTPTQQRRVVHLSPGYVREPTEINLLSGRDLRCLFPEARILKMGLRVFPNSLAAMYRVDEDRATESDQWETASGAAGLLDGEARC
jgi:methyltransferase family protein